MGLPTHTAQSFISRWILASAVGWLAGFALVVVLAMAIETIAGRVQVIVGVGMGAGIGLAQGWFLRRWLGSPWPWMWASAAGMGLPFLVQDVVRIFSQSLPTSLWMYVPVGGLVVAILQRNLLGRLADTPSVWIIPCVIGWGLPVVLIAVGDAFSDLGVFGGFLSLAGMFFGGFLLGAATARTLRSLVAGSKP